jgi:hypothetical protein
MKRFHCPVLLPSLFLTLILILGTPFGPAQASGLEVRLEGSTFPAPTRGLGTVLLEWDWNPQDSIMLGAGLTSGSSAGTHLATPLLVSAGLRHFFGEQSQGFFAGWQGTLGYTPTGLSDPFTLELLGGYRWPLAATPFHLNLEGGPELTRVQTPTALEWNTGLRVGLGFGIRWGGNNP